MLLDSSQLNDGDGCRPKLLRTSELTLRPFVASFHFVIAHGECDSLCVLWSNGMVCVDDRVERWQTTVNTDDLSAWSSAALVPRDPHAATATDRGVCSWSDKLLCPSPPRLLFRIARPTRTAGRSFPASRRRCRRRVDSFASSGCRDRRRRRQRSRALGLARGPIGITRQGT
jgi:hypothetical protein